MKPLMGMQVDKEGEDFMRVMYDIREREGWVGCFTTQEATGAIPNGTRIVKALDEPGDQHKAGDEGIVLGSISTDFGDGDVPETKLGPVPYLYFVCFDDRPGIALGIISPKIKEANEKRK